MLYPIRDERDGLRVSTFEKPCVHVFQNRHLGAGTVLQRRIAEDFLECIGQALKARRAGQM